MNTLALPIRAPNMQHISKPRDMTGGNLRTRTRTTSNDIGMRGGLDPVNNGDFAAQILLDLSSSARSV